MVERTFNLSRDKDGRVRCEFGPFVCGDFWSTVSNAIKPNQSARVTVRVEPIPEPVKWPEWAEGVVRMRVGMAWNNGGRGAFLIGSGTRIGEFGLNQLGDWPHDQSRIAENDNGYVKLSGVPNAK